MNNEKTKINLIYLKDSIIFILLLLYCMIPLLRQFSFSVKYAVENEYSILKIIGFIGIFFLVGYLIINLRKTNNSKEYIKNNLPIIIFTMYMLWTLVACIMSPDKYNSFCGTNYRKDGFISYIAYAGFFALALCLKSDKYKNILLNLFIIIAILGIVFIELPKNGYLENMFWQKDHVRGVFYNLNHYGYYLLIATSIAAFLFTTEEKIPKKICYGAEYIYLLIYLIINNTFGCYLALLGTLIIYLVISIKKKQKILISLITIGIFILVTVIVGIFDKTTLNNIQQLGFDLGNIATATASKDAETINDEAYKQAGSGRMEIWIDGLKFFAERPIFGYGPENLRLLYEANGVDQDRPHNIVIQQLTTSGLIGCLLYFTALGSILLKGIKKFESNKKILGVCLFTVISYIISAMFGNSMYYTSPYFFVILGMLMNEILKKESENKI